MIKNYIKIAWRNLLQNRILSFINILGLSIGMAAVLIIALYIKTESGYDNFHKNQSNLYRVGFNYWAEGKLRGNAPQFTPPFGPDAASEFPEIQSFVRISSEKTAYLSYGEKTLKVSDILYADSTFFNIFSYRLNKGNSLTVLKEPFSIVLTEKIAKNLFGDEEAIGKIIKLDNQTEYIVSGIAQSPPVNSHLNYNALLSFVTLYKEPGHFMDWNGGQQYTTYLQLKNGVNPLALQNKFPAFMWKHINQDYAARGFKIDALLQPVKDIHLHYDSNSDTLRTNLYVFGLVSLFILFISCINYINLTTAQSVKRLKEIGVRKLLGAQKAHLIKQFVGEAILVAFIAFIITLLLVIILLPIYKQLTGKDIILTSVSTLSIVFVLLIVTVITAIISGSYIAFYLSSFSISKTFKALMPKTSSPFNFRRTLIVIQFVITTGLMASVLIISLQLRYSKMKSLGFDRKEIIGIPLIGENAAKSYSLLKQQLLQFPEIKEVSGVSEIPYDGIQNNGFIPEGSQNSMVIHQLDGDESLLKTFGIKLISGNFFSQNAQTLSSGYVINETLAKTLGWSNPIGKTITRNGDHKVIGVVKDFHFASLHDKIEPLIITNKPWDGNYYLLAVKYSSSQPSVLINKIKQLWKTTLGGNSSFDYWFLDDAFNTIYKSEQKFQQLFFFFSTLSIILSLAGIFGMVLLMLQRRTKEFGIRKVLGANVADVLKISTAEFVWLIIIAALIAAPLSWYYTTKWLQNFAYRIELSWWMFAVASFVVLFLALLIISIQASKTALANPVKSLRTE
ncbi:MAG TPA: ABC transporter permease [Chitinophagaceae bacterium]|nr:ABC transporter permease [Chitinophagaceae bacterium]